MLFSLDEGPYYCVRIIPAVDSTLGGIPVNKHCQVLNAEQQPIDGLYAVGQDASGFWGNFYYQTEHTNALTQAWSLTSGRIASAYIAELNGVDTPYVHYEGGAEEKPAE